MRRLESQIYFNNSLGLVCKTSEINQTDNLKNIRKTGSNCACNMITRIDLYTHIIPVDFSSGYLIANLYICVVITR